MSLRTAVAVVIVFLFAAGSIAVPSTSGGPAAPDGEEDALPTPGVNCQAAGTPAEGTVRYFPEPEQTNDFVGYYEAVECFEAMEAAYPERMEVKTVADSYGLINHATQQRESNPVYVVEVTNEESTIPFEDKVKVVLMLSIHGNEKGGREGGFRVLEDFVRNMGVATMPATGHPGSTLYDLMDYAAFVLLFANTDGWVWDEPEYAQPADCTYPGFYKRVNGNCTDLNRQLPTQGWQYVSANQGRLTLNEPEPIGYAEALLEYTNIAYAADIHGMLNPADGCAYGVCTFTDDAAPTGEDVYGHFILGLISAGQLTPHEMLRSTRLAELLSERLNNNDKFAAWNSVPSTSVWGGEFYQWSTVWDTIGYTDSGISGDWFLQDTGLDAPGMDFEMAYNHITFDSAYPGVAQLMNYYHVETVRQIARTYLEAAVTDVQTSIEAHGKTTGYLYNPTILTSDSDEPLTGWAKQNPHDDLWDYEHVPYTAAPIDYFREMAPFVKDGDRPAVFESVEASELSLDRLAAYDNFVVAGSAVEQLNADRVAALQQYVVAGGNLVVTDEAMQLLADLGVVEDDKVDVFLKYAGFTLMVDRDHPFAEHSVKLSRQTYEPVPIGYPVGGQAPVWYVNRTAIQAAGGEVVGVVPQEGSVGTEGEANLGRVAVGDGTISFLGALLPDPTAEFYHPYGLESYATTYFGNLLLYNMLGAEQVFEEPPIVLEDVGELRKARETTGNGSDPADVADTDGRSSALGSLLVVATLLAAAALAGRRRR